MFKGKFRKIIAMGVVAIMAFSLGACGNRRTAQASAYFLSDESWEAIVRDNAASYGKDETWIQNALNSGIMSSDLLDVPALAKKGMYAVIYDNVITVTESGSTAIYSFYHTGDNYIGQGFYGEISFVLSDDILTIFKNGGVSVKYEQDVEYRLSEAKSVRLSAPTDFEYSSTDLLWHYPGATLPLGFICGGADVKRAGTQNFVVASMYHAIPLFGMCLIVNFQDLQLTQGINMLRIYSVGGPYLYVSEDLSVKEIRLTTNSNYVSFYLKMDAEGNITTEKI